MKTSTHLWQYLAHFFLEWEIFQTKVVEKIKTHVLYKWEIMYKTTGEIVESEILSTFPRKSSSLWGNVEIRYSQTGHRWKSKMSHAHCMLDN